MATKTKEEHLAELVSANIEKSGAVARTTFGWLQQLAEARAERDAAKEDSRLTLEEHLRVVAERDAARTERSKHRDDLECKVREALGHCLPYPEYTDEQVAGFVRAVVEELAALKSAPRPKPAPVVGGVKETKP